MKDEKTGIEIHAELDQTVIRATHRPCDLIPAFLGVIKETPEYVQMTDTNNWNLSVISDPTATDDDDRWDSEDIYWLLESLFDVLSSYAPDGYCFGSTDGDGSDFGYWSSEYLELT